ncbi:MAG: hypothetical protein J6X05_03015 [Bacteroidales bacterium]|nr:hypothetical protein [Bacteroidales bacterium]
MNKLSKKLSILFVVVVFLTSTLTSCRETEAEAERKANLASQYDEIVKEKDKYKNLCDSLSNKIALLSVNNRKTLEENHRLWGYIQYFDTISNKLSNLSAILDNNSYQYGALGIVSDSSLLRIKDSINAIKQGIENLVIGAIQQESENNNTNFFRYAPDGLNNLRVENTRLKEENDRLLQEKEMMKKAYQDTINFLRTKLKNVEENDQQQIAELKDKLAQAEADLNRYKNGYETLIYENQQLKEYIIVKDDTIDNLQTDNDRLKNKYGEIDVQIESLSTTNNDKVRNANGLVIKVNVKWNEVKENREIFFRIMDDKGNLLRPSNNISFKDDNNMDISASCRILAEYKGNKEDKYKATYEIKDVKVLMQHLNIDIWTNKCRIHQGYGFKFEKKKDKQPSH